FLLLGLENGWWLRDASGQRSKTFPDLTYWQVAVFFSTYVFFQVWNQINCRSLTPEGSGFHRLFRHPGFLGIVGTIVVVQIVIVTFGGEVFEVAPLGPLSWLLIALFTASVLVYAELTRQIRLALMREAAYADERIYPAEVVELPIGKLERGDAHGRYQRRPHGRGD